jgi:hypothetical protein
VAAGLVANAAVQGTQIPGTVWVLLPAILLWFLLGYALYSFVPPFTPVLMPVRLALGQVPGWAGGPRSAPALTAGRPRRPGHSLRHRASAHE